MLSSSSSVVIEVAEDVIVKVVFKFYMHSVPPRLEIQSHTEPQISFIQKLAVCLDRDGTH